MMVAHLNSLPKQKTFKSNANGTRLNFPCLDAGERDASFG